METESKIITLFEFTQKGYEDTQKQLKELLDLQKKLASYQDDAKKAYAESSKELEKLSKQYEKYNKTISKDSSKKVREDFERTKKSLIELQTAAQGYTTKMSDLEKQQEATAKKIKETKSTYDTYNKVLGELSKGLDNAKINMEQLTTARKHLQKELDKTELGTEKYKALSREMAQVTNAINYTRKAQQQQNKENAAQAGSVEELRQKVIRLKNEWKSLNQNSPEFAKVRDELKSTTDELEKAEAAVGIYSRNVGNYKSALDGLGGSITGLAPDLASSVSGIQKLTAASKAFILTPIGAIITAIVAALAALKAAFTASAEGQEKYNKVLGVLEGIFTVLRDTVADFGEYLISIFESPQVAYQKFKKYVLDPLLFQFKVVYNTAMGVGNAIAGIFSKEAREKSKQYFQNIKDDFKELKQTALDVWDGITNKVEKMSLKAQEGLRIAKMENELIRFRLKTTQELADNESKIAELRNKAVARDKKDVAQQLQAVKQLQEAQQLITRNAEIRIQQAQKEYNIQKAKNALGKSTQEDLQKEADLRAAVVQAQKAATDQQREIITQIAEINASTKEAYKTLINEIITGQTNIANAQAKVRELENKKAEKSEIDVAKKSLQAYTENLQAKQDILKQYQEANIKLTQQEQDNIELAQLLGAKAVEDINRAANEKAITTYNELVAGVRDAQAKIIAAQKSGNAELTELYVQLLAARQQKLEEFDQAQLEYTEEQKEAKQIADEEYRAQQEQEYVNARQNLLQLEVEYNNTENAAQREKLADQIENQKVALNTIGELVAASGTNIEELWEREKKFVADASDFTTDRLSVALDQLGEFADKGAAIYLKQSKSIVKSISKIFDLKKQLKKGEVDLKQFRLGVAQTALLTMSDAVANVNDLITEGLERQKESVQNLADFQLDLSRRTYESQQRELDKSLSNGEISEARYRIEQIKAEDAQAEKEKEIEREKANKMYDIEAKQFRVKKATDIAQALINVALGVTSVLSMGIVGIALAPVIAALGAVQVANISKRQPPEKPKFAQGGLLPFVNIEGPSHDQGGVPVSIGNKKVAEVEGGEGALILSKKAMKNRQIQTLVGIMAAMNERISGTNPEGSNFEDGGYLTYEDFYNKAYAGLKVKRKRRKLWVNGKFYKLPNKGRGTKQEEIMKDVADSIASEQFEAYRQQELAKLEAEESRLTSSQNIKIAANERLAAMGISDYAGYSQATQAKTERQKELQDSINAYKELADVQEAALKKQMDYDAKIAKFKEQTAEADKELSDSTLKFNTKILDEMLEAGEISAKEHASYIDQITKGYGASTQDIINLKKKQVEATKVLLEEERQAEITAAENSADFRTQALEKIREDWNLEYEATTEQLLENISVSNEAISKLTGNDLLRYQEMVKMSERIKEIDEETARLNAQSSALDVEMNDGIIKSREEQLRLQEEQKRIQEEVAAKAAEREAEQKKLDEAKEKFEEERQNNMEKALSAFEAENFDTILAKVKELGLTLEENEKNNWTLEKALAKELEDQLAGINKTYDEQVAAQDKIIDGYNEELEQLELIHDKKVADIKAEQALFEENFNLQKSLIDKAYADAVEGLQSELQDINAILANLKIAGVETGMSVYEKGISSLTEQVNNLPTKYATGGVMELGSGVYNAMGPSHLNGGIPVTIGNSKIAEIEGGEKMFTVNKFASADPRVTDALKTISDINASYSGVPLISNEHVNNTTEIDYKLLATLIGHEINSRPVQTYVTDSAISLVGKIEAAKKTASMMM